MQMRRVNNLAGREGGEVNELSLFTGAGGGLLGTKLLGWTPIGYVENDEYCQRVIEQRIRDGFLEEAPIFGDIRAFIGEGYARAYQGMVDVITAGFPCQFYSTATHGMGRKKKDLWAYCADVIRIVRPTWVFLENVPRAFKDDVVVAEAGALGAPHRRKRGWLVAYSDSNGESRCPINEKMACIPKIPRCTWWGEDMAWTVGMDDGVAHRMDRLRALGNGQVPAVVAAVWGLLMGRAGKEAK